MVEQWQRHRWQAETKAWFHSVETGRQLQPWSFFGGGKEKNGNKDELFLLLFVMTRRNCCSRTGELCACTKHNSG